MKGRGREKIHVTGTKAEMMERLTGVLKVRELDVLVRELMTDPGSEMGSEGSVEV